MSYKPTLLIEPDLFYEDETQDTKAIMAKYFVLEEVDPSRIQIPNLVGKEFRTSLNMARRMLVNTKPYDCTSWVPHLREFMISPRTTQFNELGFIKNYMSGSDFPLFVRPNNGYKTFSGQVFYGIEEFEKEYKWLKQQNVGDDLLCMYDTNPPILFEEYRCVFIDHKFVDMSIYMDRGEIEVKRLRNNKVQNDIIRQFAEKVLKKLQGTGHILNIPNLVIDVANFDYTNTKSPALIEINMFETASFYACDLDKIYSAWQQQIFKSNES
jgi:hypothetical protein